MYNTLVQRGRAHLALFLATARADNNIPTAGVDSNGLLYINFDWLESLTIRQVEAVLTHEALHITLNHFKRFEKLAEKYPKNQSEHLFRMANFAADAHINAYLPDLHSIGAVTFKTLADATGLPEGELSKMSTEALTEKLMEHSDKLEDEETLDVHIMGGQGEQDESEGSKGPSAESVRQAAQDIFDSMSDQTKQSLSSSLGGGEMFFSEEPRINPVERELQKLMGASWMSKNVPSFSRKNRRLSDSSLLLKGKGSVYDKPIVDVYIDVSGSMSHEAPKWVAFGQALARKYGGQFRVSLWSDEVPEPSLEVPKKFKSGGTNWRGLSKHVKRTRIPHHRLVIITDGEGCSNGDVDNADLIVIATSNGTCNHPNEIKYNIMEN